jgi:hypothetical protein
MPQAAFGSNLDFFQMSGRCRVSGEGAGRTLDFLAARPPRTFRGR